MNKPKITIENLAIIMQKGFDGIDKRFDKMDKRITDEIENLALMIKKGFDDVDERFKKVDERFDEIDKKFDDNAREHWALKKELSEFGQKLENIDMRLANVYVFELTDLRARVEVLERKIITQQV